MQPIFNRLRMWIREYSRSVGEDQRAIQDFMECETTEAVKALQAELYQIRQGNYLDEALEKLVGKPRKEKFGTYEEWAKMMLMWIASYKA